MPHVVSTIPNNIAPPSEATIVFAADWGTATGTSTNAITDGSVMDVLSGSALLEVIVADTDLAGLPSTWPLNLLETSINGGADHMVGWNTANPASWSAPAVGETLWLRLLAYQAGNSWVGELHNWESNINDIVWAFLDNSGSPTWTGGFKTYLAGSGNGTINGGGSGGFDVTGVPSETGLRYALGIEKVSGTTLRFYPRIYNAETGSLIADETGLTWRGGGTFAGGSLADFQTGGGVWDYSSITADGTLWTTQADRDAVAFRCMRIGQQGPGGASTGIVMYYGGLVAATGAEPGAYSSGEGP